MLILFVTFTQAYDFFGGGQKGHDACVAFFSLTAIGSIDTMIANFLTRWVILHYVSLSLFLNVVSSLLKVVCFTLASHACMCLLIFSHFRFTTFCKASKHSPTTKNASTDL